MKSLSKTKKKLIIIINIIILIGISSLLIVWGIKSNNANTYMQKFINVMTSGHFNTAYTMLPSHNKKDLDKESFEEAYQALNITTGKIKTAMAYNNNTTYNYHVSFYDKKDKIVASYEYEIVKQKEKKLLFFPTWKINECDMQVKNLTITVPENANISMNGVDLKTKKYSSSTISYDELESDVDIYEPNWIIYEIPCLWATQYEIKVTGGIYDNYNTTWLPEEASSLELFHLQYHPQQKWRGLYAKYIKEHLSDFISSESFVTDYPYGFFDMNGDNIPEMFLLQWLGTAAIYQQCYTIRNDEVVVCKGNDNNEFPIQDSEGGQMYFTKDNRLLVSCFHTAHTPVRGALYEYTLQDGIINQNEIVSFYDTEFEQTKNGEYIDISKKETKKLLEQYGCQFANGKIHISGNELIDFNDVATLILKEAIINNLEQIDDDIYHYQLVSSEAAKTVEAEESDLFIDNTEGSDTGNVYYYKKDDFDGYRMLIPDDFHYLSYEDDIYFFTDSDNWQNEYYYSVDNTLYATLTWTGCSKENISDERNVSFYSNGKEMLKKYDNDNLSYKKAGKNYCCMSYTNEDDTIIYYEAYYCDKDIFYGFNLSYPKNRKEQYDSIINKLSKYVIEGNN